MRRAITELQGEREKQKQTQVLPPHRPTIKIEISHLNYLLYHMLTNYVCSLTKHILNLF